MDQLEKIIGGMKEALHDEQPHEGHLERFRMKLDARDQKKRWFQNKYLLSAVSAAAVVALLLLLVPGEQDTQNTMTLGSISPQYADVEHYYTSSIDKQAEKLVALNQQMGGDQGLDLLINEVKQYDQVYQQLCTDLNATPNDQRVINALITYYQTKLELINKILNELNAQQQNNDNHENINI